MTRVADKARSDVSLTEEIQRFGQRLVSLHEVGGPVAPEPDVLLAELGLAHEELRVADEEGRVQQAELDRLLDDRRQARRAQERFMSLLPAAVLVTDAAGAISFANPAAAAFLGVPLDKLAGKPLFAFIQ